MLPKLIDAFWNSKSPPRGRKRRGWRYHVAFWLRRRRKAEAWEGRLAGVRGGEEEEGGEEGGPSQ